MRPTTIQENISRTAIAQPPGTYRAMQVTNPQAGFELVARAVVAPGPAQVRIAVEACGICHSDSFTREGTMPGVQYPRVPGHEVIGRIDAIGDAVTDWRLGQRVGVGWFGGNCGHCDACRRGLLMQCHSPQIPGLTGDGGYAELMVAHQSALVRIADDLEAAEAAPLLCAGVTTFNGLRNSEARAGDLVAIVGIGGLGHLAIQFAAHMGFVVAAIGRGGDKASLARSLGADHYIDTASVNPSDELKRLGGASLVLATVPNADAMTATLDGLRVGGRLVAVGASPEPINVSPIQLIAGDRSLHGTAAGSSIDSEDTVAFAAKQRVRAMVEVLPLERAAEGYDRMMSGKARFRVVLKVGR